MAGSAMIRDSLRDQTASPALVVGHGAGKLGSSQWCVKGRQDAAPQAETKEVQAGGKEKSFSHKGGVSMGQRPRKAGYL